MAENNIHADGQEILSSGIPIFLYVLSICIYIYMSRVFLEIGQWGSSGPPSVILGGPFLRKGVQERGSHKRYLNLLVQTLPWENEHLFMFCRHFGTFCATEKTRAQMTAESRMFVWWIMTQTKRRKAIETVRGYQSKFIERPSNQCCSQGCDYVSDSFSKKKILSLGL